MDSKQGQPISINHKFRCSKGHEFEQASAFALNFTQGTWQAERRWCLQCLMEALDKLMISTVEEVK